MPKAETIENCVFKQNLRLYLKHVERNEETPLIIIKVFLLCPNSNFSLLKLHASNKMVLTVKIRVVSYVSQKN